MSKITKIFSGDSMTPESIRNAYLERLFILKKQGHAIRPQATTRERLLEVVAEALEMRFERPELTHSQVIQRVIGF